MAAPVVLGHHHVAPPALLYIDYSSDEDQGPAALGIPMAQAEGQGNAAAAPPPPQAAPVFDDVVVLENAERVQQAVLLSKLYAFKFPHTHRPGLKLKQHYYAMLKSGEAGCAHLLNLLHGAAYFCSGTADFWSWSEEMRLWVPFERIPLKLRFRALLQEVANGVLQAVRGERATAQALGDKEDAAVWNGIYRRVETAFTSISSVRFLDNVLLTLHEAMFDAKAFQLLDSRRDILSFRNGVVSLRAGAMRPRQPKELLSYALPYDFNAGASTADMEAWVHNLFEDPVTERAFQATCGYFCTAETSVKAFWQVSAPSNSGKTQTFKILAHALGDYCSVGEVPIHEFTDVKFEDALYRVLQRRPSPRLIIFDEIGIAVTLKEELLNQLSDGSEEQRVSLKNKGKPPESVVNRAKYAFMTNHTLHIPASSTGLVLRDTGFDFKLQFTAHPVGDHERPRDDVLLEKLLKPEGRAGVAKWLVEGAQRFYADPGAIQCVRFEEASFRLQVQGDPYLKWLAETWTPTGLDEDRISLESLVRLYKDAGRNPATNAGAYDGLAALLDTMRNFVYSEEWDEWGTLTRGYTGLRKRRHQDAPFEVQRTAATLVRQGQHPA